MANPYGQLTSSLLFDACVWPLHLRAQFSSRELLWVYIAT